MRPPLGCGLVEVVGLVSVGGEGWSGEEKRKYVRRRYIRK